MQPDKPGRRTTVSWDPCRDSFARAYPWDPRRRPSGVSRFLPKSLICLREGYSRRSVLADTIGGLTVAVIALPLAMALGIASIPASVAADLQAQHPWLSPPAMGLYTAVIAGFLISALGGSRVQIGGPTAAFIPIVFGIASVHGYTGLALATLMAGVIVMLMGLFRFGAMIKFIPYPVTTGFTAGIAVTIIASQVRDFLGITALDGSVLPLSAEFVPKLQELARHAQTTDPSTALVGVGSLAVLIALRRFAPRVPGAIVAVTLAAIAVSFLGLDRAHGGGVETIGSRFGSIPRTLPAPHLPVDPSAISWQMVRDLILPATTIALLCAIESLLSAVVADGMTGNRHKSDCELVAQGAANIGSALFFGLPATGAIARTVANIKAGGRTPLAGVLHAVFLLLFMLAAADLAARVPLASLAAVLFIVAWNISEIGHFRALLRAPRSDVLVLLTTFGLTVLTDLTIAVAVGMVLASMLFMKRMADVANIGAITREFRDPGENGDADPDAIAARQVPPGVEVYEIDGPFFFGVADRLKDTLGQFERPPKVFILRLRKVPAIDASGLHALEEFLHKCRRAGTTLLLSGVHAQPMMAFAKSGLDQTVGVDNMFGHIDEALQRARGIVG
ncbi:MAG: STAS domain-containing protein [Phycisphaeraceae bacterium]|nr:STAS domain-containing protein [Phycisphaeraceae bacterium]